jgi:hypothetical protein
MLGKYMGNGGLLDGRRPFKAKLSQRQQAFFGEV